MLITPSRSVYAPHHTITLCVHMPAGCQRVAAW
jgi:hypothetical protein